MWSDGTAGGWVPVARETFEYNLVPWFGRRYAPWLRTWAREHPTDPRGQVLIPQAIDRAFTGEHRIGESVSARRLEQMGYPRLPGEAELAEVRAVLHTAMLRGAVELVPTLTRRAQAPEEQIAATKRRWATGVSRWPGRRGSHVRRRTRRGPREVRRPGLVNLWRGQPPRPPRPERSSNQEPAVNLNKLTEKAQDAIVVDANQAAGLVGPDGQRVSEAELVFCRATAPAAAAAAP